MGPARARRSPRTTARARGAIPRCRATPRARSRGRIRLADVAGRRSASKRGRRAERRHAPGLRVRAPAGPLPPRARRRRRSAGRHAALADARPAATCSRSRRRRALPAPVAGGGGRRGRDAGPDRGLRQGPRSRACRVRVPGSVGRSRANDVVVADLFTPDGSRRRPRPAAPLEGRRRARPASDCSRSASPARASRSCTFPLPYQ